MTKAVIMAGGKGTRLQSVTKDIPKPMTLIGGRPVLEYQIDSLKASGICAITLVIGHLGHVIREHFGNGEAWGVRIDYITEEEPLGTAGALYYLKDRMDDDFLLLFGDLMLDIDWNRFLAFHREKGGDITLFGHPNSHPYDSDLLVTDENDRVLRIAPKGEPRLCDYDNLVNAGVYCLKASALRMITAPRKLDLERDIIAALLREGAVFVYRSTEYVKDIGTPDRLLSVSRDTAQGTVASRSLRHWQRAIFLDRDGTINVPKGYVRTPDEFELLPGAAQGIQKINASGYLAIVATNQPVLARGECTPDTLTQIHQRMSAALGDQGAYVDDLFFCPHHPHKGYPGEVPALKIDCNCRKPKIGLLLQAAQRHHLDLSQCWMVGDTSTDIQTGVNANMHTVLVRTGDAGRDGHYAVKADFEADDLSDAVELILAQPPR